MRAQATDEQSRFLTTYKDRLTHEGELLRIPDVAIIDGAHEDIGIFSSMC